MHPETQLQVARFEHQQRVAEATRVVSVLRAFRAQRRAAIYKAAQRALESGGHDAVPARGEAVPRWAM